MCELNNRSGINHSLACAVAKKCGEQNQNRTNPLAAGLNEVASSILQNWVRVFGCLEQLGLDQLKIFFDLS